MILSERKKETLETLANLRKQYQYLISDQTLELISKKQFRESEQRIIEETDKIIEEWGFTADDLGEAPVRSVLNDLFGEAFFHLNNMSRMLNTSYDAHVHEAIDEIFPSGGENV